MNNLNNEYVTTKEVYLKLVKEFKDSTKNDDFKPYYGKDWNGDKKKIKGKLAFEHYIFYALLKNKDITKVTHSVDSETYLDALSKLKGKSEYIFKLIQVALPSLSKDDFDKIIDKIK